MKIFKYSLLVSSLFITNNAIANTAYISNTGTGDGYSEEMPASLSNVNKLLSDESISKIVLKAGLYEHHDAIYILSGSTPVSIVGEGRVVLSSDYDYITGGNSGVMLARSNIKFENINFLNTRYCFRFKNNPVENIQLRNINAHNIMSCIEVDSNVSQTIRNIKIAELNVVGYYKAGMRLNGESTSDIQVHDSSFDAMESSPDEHRDCHITGISISRGVSNVAISGVNISNNIGRAAGCGSYQQGDGILINSGVDEIRITDTTISNSKDADFDIKGSNVSLTKVTSSSGTQGRYNFKLWNNDFSCIDCYVNTSQLVMTQAINSSLTFIDSTIRIREDSHICDIRDDTDTDKGIAFENTSFSLNGDINVTPKNVASCTP